MRGRIDSRRPGLSLCIMQPLTNIASLNRIMQCNIDSKGKAVRWVSGVVTLIVGVILVGLILTGVLAGYISWAVAGVLTTTGLFQIYEGWCGWCVIRAMGFKTPV